jgi:hypothetical protein
MKKATKGIIVIVSVFLVLALFSVIAFAIYSYIQLSVMEAPLTELSNLDNYGIPYIRLREIENLPNAIDYDGGQSFFSEYPINNLIQIKRRINTEADVNVIQKITVEQYLAVLDFTYFQGRSHFMFDRYVQEEKEKVWLPPEEKPEDLRFDELNFYRSRLKNSFHIVLIKDLRCFSIYYSGKLEPEVFLNWVDQYLKSMEEVTP